MFAQACRQLEKAKAIPWPVSCSGKRGLDRNGRRLFFMTCAGAALALLESLSSKLHALHREAPNRLPARSFAPPSGIR